MTHVVNILESFLGECRKHNEDNGQASFDCPACSDDKGLSEGDGKGNLEINYYKDVFRCWVCKDINGMSGGVTKLFKKYGNKKLLSDYRLLQPEKFFDDKEGEVKLLALPEGYKELKDCTEKDYKYNTAMTYLFERGITKKIIEDFKIGFTTIGNFANRIILPSYGEEGNLNYFIARWFVKQFTKVKYVNPDTPKQEIIFNEQRINWDATIYLVEGGFDHIVVPNSIPLLGKDVSEVLLYALHEKAKANIVVLLDGDAYENAKALYWKLNFGKLKGRIRICKIPESLDPSKIFEKYGNIGLAYYLRSPKRLKVDILNS